MDFSRTSALSSLLFRPLDFPKRTLLFREWCIKLGVSIVLLETAFRQFLGGGEEERLAEVFGSKLASKGQPRGGEQHLLADGRRVGNVGDDEELGRGVEATEDDIEGDIGLEMLLQADEVLAKGGAC